jgi:hypothetical protein
VAILRGGGLLYLTRPGTGLMARSCGIRGLVYAPERKSCAAARHGSRLPSFPLFPIYKFNFTKYFLFSFDSDRIDQAAFSFPLFSSLSFFVIPAKSSPCNAG